VEVTYVVNPSLFFVRKVAMKAKFLQLEKDLMTYGNDEENLKKPINIKQGTRLSLMLILDLFFLTKLLALFHCFISLF